jgi:hypothetical protein
MNDQELEQLIQSKGLTAPRLTPEAIESKIESATYTILPSGKVMVCELMLTNGYSIRGEAATVSKANFDEEVGRIIFLKNAKDKIWQLEGYLLQEVLSR